MSNGRPAARKRRRPPSDFAAVLLAVALALLAAWFVGGAIYDGIRRGQDRPQVARRWPSARRLVAGRLGQPEPLEFGAVWATRSGLICGLVNG